MMWDIAKLRILVVIGAVCACLGGNCLSDNSAGTASSSSAWPKNFTETMGNADNWKILQMTEPPAEKITVVDGPDRGSHLLLWDGDDLVNNNKSIFFCQEIEITDFSAYERITFKLKGNGKDNCMKLMLYDADGGWVGYGPFTTTGTEWRNFEAILEWPTYSTTWREQVLGLPEGSAGFDLRRVTSVRIVQQDAWGLMNTTAAFAVKDFALLKEGEGASEAADHLYKSSSINENGNLLVDGKPVLPLGIYTTIGTGDLSDSAHWFKVIKEAGFNMVHSYTVHSAEDYEPWLDNARAAELTVMACVYPHMVEDVLPEEPVAREAEIDRRKEALKERIDIVKDHPAMAVYNITDECYNSGIPKEQVRLFYDYIKTMDSVHPTLAVECTNPAFPTYRKATDIFALDIYPIGNNKPYPTDITDIATRLDLIKTVQAGTPPKPDLWAVLQIFKSTGDNTRFPREDEMRAMTFLALTRDVKGFVFFILNWPNFTVPYSDSQPEHWANVSDAINSVHTVIPAMLHGKTVDGYEVDKARIHTIAKDVVEDGRRHLYLLAVNPSDGKKMARPVEVRFSGLPAIKGDVVSVLDEDASGALVLGGIRKLGTSSSGFTDSFAENAVHVYKMELR